MSIDTVYQVFYHRTLSGASLAATLAALDVPRSTYYDWVRDHPEEAASAKAKAEAQARADLADRQERLGAAQRALQDELTDTVVSAMNTLMKQLLADADEGTPWFRLGLWRELKSFLQDGVQPTASAAEMPRLPPGAHPALPSSSAQRAIAFDNVHSVRVEGIDGSEVEFKPAHPLDGEVVEE